jgi:hypothetical protein
MSTPRRRIYTTSAAALLFLSLIVRVDAAASEPGVCSGTLTTSESRFVIEEEPEHICIFGVEERKKIFAVCSEGHRCEVEGILNDCKDYSGECSEITDISGVRDLTLAQRQEQPPLPDADVAIPSEPAEIARLPAEIRSNVETVTRTCGSQVTIQGDFSTYLADRDNRFIALHFENIHFENTRCADLRSICKERGCLHRVYASRNNQPYQMIASNYVIEVELGHFDGAVGAKVTSKERTRIVRWDFH